jgi:hypothetical protein
MIEGSTAYRTLGAQSYRTGPLAALAEAYLKRGQTDEAAETCLGFLRRRKII